MSRTALIAGATGLVGDALLREMSSRRDYELIKVLGRNPPRYESGRIHFLPSDYSNLAELGPELAVDDVYCCLGTTLKRSGSEAAFERVDYHMVVDLARAAGKAGAKKFLVVSAVGATEKSPAFYPRVKARMEKAVAEAGFETVHIVRPSLLLGERKERRLVERLFQWLAPVYSPLLAGPLKRYRPVPASVVAASLISLANRPDKGVHIHHLPLESDRG